MRTGRSIDAVKSYTALRSIAIQGDRFMLNGRPLSAAAGAGPGILAGDGVDGAG